MGKDGVASEEDERGVVCRPEDGSGGGVVAIEVLETTTDGLSSPGSVADVVIPAYTVEGVIGTTSTDVAIGKVSKSVGIVGVPSMVVTIVVAGPFDMIIGVSPVFVDADIVLEMACQFCTVLRWSCGYERGDEGGEVAVTWCGIAGE